jgi:ribosomal protein L11 methyltransferase
MGVDDTPGALRAALAVRVGYVDLLGPAFFCVDAVAQREEHDDGAWSVTGRFPLAVTPDLLRVVVPVEPGAEEAVRARMLELAPGGFEEAERDGAPELVAYGDEADAARIRATFPDAVTTVVSPGWEDAWRGFHTGVVAGGVWVGPPWDEPVAGLPAVVIDPGRAFGTGAHATTRLCLELLDDAPRGSLLDVGCGSGVLAIAAVRLGFAPVLGVDLDPVAVETAAANAAVNEVAVEIRLADAERGVLPAVDVAVANILLAPVEAVLRRVDAGWAVTSGYLSHERPSHPGWEHVRSLHADGWAADLLRRSSV